MNLHRAILSIFESVFEVFPEIAELGAVNLSCNSKKFVCLCGCTVSEGFFSLSYLKNVAGSSAVLIVRKRVSGIIKSFLLFPQP